MFLKNCLISGANGFIGSQLVLYLEKRDFKLSVALRSVNSRTRENCISPTFFVGDIDGNTCWTDVLEGNNAVVHLANRAHVLAKAGNALDARYHEVDVAGTLNFAQQAAKAGVRRFIYISSIKVNGESTDIKAFRFDDVPNPQDAYAISKYQAEEALKRVCLNTGMEYVIIRPPLIYGPDVKGNLQTLCQAIDKGYPFPFGSISNSRDLVSVQNLCALIAKCLRHPGAANQTFLCSDGHPLSTPELIRHIASARGKADRVVRFPRSALRLLCSLLGKSTSCSRLTDNLEVDIEHTCTALEWRPPFSVNDSFKSAFSLKTDKTIA